MPIPRRSIQLTTVLSVGFAVLGTLPLIGLLWLNQTRLEDAVLKSLDRQLQDAERDALETVTTLHEQATHVMPLLATTVASDLERFRGPTVDNVLHAAMVSVPAIDAIYVSFEDGSHRVVSRVDRDRRQTAARIPAEARWHISWINPVSDDPERKRHRNFHSDWGTPLEAVWAEDTQFDPRTLPHYRRALQTGSMSMVKPSINPDTGFPVVSLAHPIVVDGAFVGIVGVNLTFRRLSAHLARNRVSPGGLTIVIDSAGHIIAHPDPVRALRAAPGSDTWPSLADVVSPQLAAAAATLDDSHESTPSVMDLDGETYHLLSTAWHPPGSEPWTVFTAAPESDFVGETRKALQTLAVVIGSLTIFQILLIGFFARRVGSRIEEMSARFQTIHRLQFEGGQPAQPRGVWIRELAELESGFQLLRRSAETFSRFVPRRVVAHLLTTDRPMEPAVEQRELALFFCDLQGFTSLAEHAEPELLLQQISEYFHAVTSAVTAEGGTIDKFIGDAVMAFWGAPDASADPALAAARAALRVAHRLADLPGRWESEGRHPLKIRIGLHIAPVLVGTIGTDARLSYTALGDGVNVAARLEGANRELGTVICVSDAIRKAAPGLVCRPLRRLRVKGRTEPLLVHELLGLAGDEDPELQAPGSAAARVDCGHAVTTSLAQGEEASAMETLRTHLSADPKDQAASALLDWLKARQTHPQV